jgi:hypothetical protein
MMTPVLCERVERRHPQEKCASKCVRGNVLSAFILFLAQRFLFCMLEQRGEQVQRTKNTPLRTSPFPLSPDIRKGSLTGKAVVLKTTAHSFACRFESCPFRQSQG